VELLLHQRGEVSKRLEVRLAQLTWATVDDAQGAYARAVGSGKRLAGVEADMGLAGDERVVREPLVLERVRNNEGIEA
jgi:hypothetical protein